MRGKESTDSYIDFTWDFPSKSSKLSLVEVLSF